MAYADSTSPNIRLSERHWAVRFAGAILATAIALGIWFLWPVMHEDPFAIFIAAVNMAKGSSCITGHRNQMPSAIAVASIAPANRTAQWRSDKRIFGDVLSA